MEKLIEALKRVNPSIDYENETALVTGKIIDSIDMTSILAHLNAIPPDNQDKKELDVDTVNRMFATLKKHGCNYRFDH